MFSALYQLLTEGECNTGGKGWVECDKLLPDLLEDQLKFVRAQSCLINYQLITGGNIIQGIPLYCVWGQCPTTSTTSLTGEKIINCALCNSPKDHYAECIAISLQKDGNKGLAVSRIRREVDGRKYRKSPPIDTGGQSNSTDDKGDSDDRTSKSNLVFLKRINAVKRNSWIRWPEVRTAFCPLTGSELGNCLCIDKLAIIFNEEKVAQIRVDIVENTEFNFLKSLRYNNPSIYCKTPDLWLQDIIDNARLTPGNLARLRKECGFNEFLVTTLATVDEERLSSSNDDRLKQREGYKKWYERNREKLKSSNRRWLQANRDRTNEANRKWRQANPEKYHEAKRRWRENNPDKERERKQRWLANNREKDRERSRKWRENNREKDRERARRWRRNNRQKVNEYQRRWYNKQRVKFYNDEGREIEVILADENGDPSTADDLLDQEQQLKQNSMTSTMTGGDPELKSEEGSDLDQLVSDLVLCTDIIKEDNDMMYSDDSYPYIDEKGFSSNSLEDEEVSNSPTPTCSGAMPDDPTKEPVCGDDQLSDLLLSSLIPSAHII